MSDKLEIDGIRLERTCTACPEQYDAFTKSGRQVGYLRLRHGHFRVDYPDCGDDEIFEAYPEGDGIFNDEEREGFLKQAVAAIRSRLADEASQ